MLDNVLIKNYPAPPIKEREILRYAGCSGEADEATQALLKECLLECAAAFSYRVCYRVFDVKQEKQSFAKKFRGLRKGGGVCGDGRAERG